MANAQILKALVVDDNFMIRGIYRRMLVPKGFEVTEAENGKIAVDYFHDGNEYDLVLMDKEMPVMDGVKVVILTLFNYKLILNCFK
jgi:CheY-like chemotaxis protein